MERDSETHFALANMELRRTLQLREEEITLLEESLERERALRKKVEERNKELEEVIEKRGDRIREECAAKNRLKTARVVEQQMYKLGRPLDMGDLDTMSTHLYRCLKADVVAKSGQKRVTLTTWGRTIPHSGEVASAQEDTAKAETCASLGGTIWGALEPFLTLQESLGARQRKSARKEFLNYKVKADLGYQNQGQRDRFRKIASELDRVGAKPTNYKLFLQVKATLDRVIPASNL